MLFVRFRQAGDPQGRAWCLEVRRPFREQPGLQELDQLLLAGGMLDLGEPAQIRIRRQLSRNGALGPQKQESHLLEPAFALR